MGARWPACSKPQGASSGFSKFRLLIVYYVASRWTSQNPLANQAHAVKLMSIGQLISVKDKDSMAIGQDPMVLQDITKEIPLDAEWKRCAYQVQTTSMDVFNPGTSEAYSSTFTDLESLFKWI